jgi:hypothetical protein
VEIILHEGYKIPVRMSQEEAGRCYREKNNKSARNEMEFVRAEVARLLEAGQIIEVKATPRCTNPLSVAFKISGDGSIKRRLVIDLSRWVNEFVIPDSYKMSRFQDALTLLPRGDFQSVYDITKAYHHLRLHPDSYELVGFCVEDEKGIEHFYHYVVVVFGLGPAGQALGRVMRPILRKLTDLGVRNLMYVDNGFVIGSTKEKADKDYKLTIETFEKARFTVALDRSDSFGSSSQRKEYLGFLIKTEAMTVEVPPSKMSRIKGLLKKFLTYNSHKAREVASMLGKLNALEPALGKPFSWAPV